MILVLDSGFSRCILMHNFFDSFKTYSTDFGLFAAFMHLCDTIFGVFHIEFGFRLRVLSAHDAHPSSFVKLFLWFA